MSDILRSCAGSQRCGDMLSAGSQSLALALEDVFQRWLLAQRCLSLLGSQRLAHSAGSQRCGTMLSAGSQSLALALEDVSQHCLSVRVHKTYPGRILGFFNLDHSGSCQNLMECIHVVVESSCDAVGLDTLSQSLSKNSKCQPMINLVITHIWSPYPQSVIRCVSTRTMVKRPRVLLCSTTEKVE
jgi:hypothetical protein